MNAISEPSGEKRGCIDQAKPRTYTAKSINVQTLREWREASRPFTLIDVREPYEFDIANLEGLLIPKATVEDHLDAIPAEGDVVIHCRSGVRSADVINLLESKYGFGNLYNLEGGILAWAREIDPEMATY